MIWILREQVSITVVINGMVVENSFDASYSLNGSSSTIETNSIPMNPGNAYLRFPIFCFGRSEVVMNEIISRHPFPGPGLAIRMPGIITNEKIKILKEADHYFIQALRDHGLYHKIWQAYAALLPVKTVGVMGDNRTYEYLCLLRAITSEDGMTADFYEFKKSFMQTISNKIVNSIRGINRVVYDVTSKPPSTIELE